MFCQVKATVITPCFREYNGSIGRVLLPGILFVDANRYPKEHSHFRLQIDDFLYFSRGVWDVEYEHEKPVYVVILLTALMKSP